MLGRTHQVIGVASGLSVYLFCFSPEYSPATFGVAMVAAHLSSLLPDIDQPASLIWKKIPAGKVAGQLVNPFLQHRNLTHSILGFILIGWGLHVLFFHLPIYWGIDPYKVWVVSMAAYASHLIADSVTVEGIPLLFPIPKMFGILPHPFAGLRIETGHWFENLLIFPSVNIILILLVWTNWPAISHLILR